MQYQKMEDNKWLLSEYENEDAVINLATVDFEIELSEIYTGVNFSDTESD